MKGTGACMYDEKARGQRGMYVHCQEKGKRMERRASPTQVSKAGREEWRTSFCSSKVRERRMRQLSGSREERRDQCVETLRGSGGRNERWLHKSMGLKNPTYLHSLQHGYLRGRGVWTGRENTILSLPMCIWIRGLVKVGKGTSSIRLPMYLEETDQIKPTSM